MTIRATIEAIDTIVTHAHCHSERRYRSVAVDRIFEKESGVGQSVAHRIGG